MTGPIFGANCYLLWAGSDAVVVDPGPGVAGAVIAEVAERGLQVRAILATHGHGDHIWDAAELGARHDVPVVIHRADAYRLADPLGTIEPGSTPNSPGPLARALLAAGARVGGYREPADVRTVEPGPGGLALTFGAVEIRAIHAPGHTEGSTLYVSGPHASGEGRPSPVARAESVVCTGDVLFAGTIGRTDLPGGDDAAMARTLRNVIGGLEAVFSALGEDPAVLPGHGPVSTLAAQVAANPYLRGPALFGS